MPGEGLVGRMGLHLPECDDVVAQHLDPQHSTMFTPFIPSFIYFLFF